MSPFAPRLEFTELINAIHPDTQLMLDLKGYDVRLAHELYDVLEPRPQLARRVTICTRHWRLLGPFEKSGAPVKIVRSMRSRRELARAIAGLRRGEVPHGFSVFTRLLDAETVRQLRAYGSTVMSWPVNTASTARALVERGVSGLISDDCSAIEGVIG